ncbi:MAG: SET domain-containing methyltransferase [Betaproteobacteria bacterium]
MPLAARSKGPYGGCAPAAGADAAGCGPGGGCGETPASLGDAPGGTALYELASLANHDCDPNADVVIARGGALELRARRDVAAGEPLTVTYLDSSLHVALRRRKLLLGYGFSCECALCRAQLGRA